MDYNVPRYQVADGLELDIFGYCEASYEKICTAYRS